MTRGKWISAREEHATRNYPLVSLLPHLPLLHSHALPHGPSECAMHRHLPLLPICTTTKYGHPALTMPTGLFPRVHCDGLTHWCFNARLRMLSVWITPRESQSLEGSLCRGVAELPLFSNVSHIPSFRSYADAILCAPLPEAHFWLIEILVIHEL